MHHPAPVACLPLQAPCRLIATNAGVEGEVIVQKLAGQPFYMGYNAMDDKIQNLLEAGIIDPAKVQSLLGGRGACCLGADPTAEHSLTPAPSLPPCMSSPSCCPLGQCTCRRCAAGGLLRLLKPGFPVAAGGLGQGHFLATPGPACRVMECVLQAAPRVERRHASEESAAAGFAVDAQALPLLGVQGAALQRPINPRAASVTHPAGCLCCRSHAAAS